MEEQERRQGAAAMRSSASASTEATELDAIISRFQGSQGSHPKRFLRPGVPSIGKII